MWLFLVLVVWVWILHSQKAFEDEMEGAVEALKSLMRPIL